MQHDLSTRDAAGRKEQAGLLLKGDEALWNAVIGEVRKIVYAFERARKFPGLERADMSSATLERVFKQKARYDPERGSLRQWIWMMAESAAKDLLKSAQHRSRQLETPFGYEALACERPAERAQPSAEELHLAEILDGLPIVDRQIVLEYHRTDGAGKWAAELAPEIGLLPGTIRVKLRRLHEQIRQEFQRRGYPVGGP